MGLRYKAKHVSKMTIAELREKYYQLDEEVREIDKVLYGNESKKGVRLNELADKRFQLNSLKIDCYNEMISRKRRGLKDHNQKALNHGGIYSCPSTDASFKNIKNNFVLKGISL